MMTFLLCSVSAQEADPVEADAPAEAAAEALEEGQLLRLKYEEGEVLTYETRMEGVGSVHIAGAPQPIDMRGGMMVTMTIEEVGEDGHFTILTEVEVTRLNVNLAGNPVPPPAQEIKVRTKMTPRGEILDVDVLDEAIPEARQHEWEAAMERMMTGGLDLRRMLMGQRIAAFPEDAVLPGDEWTGSAIDIDIEDAGAPLQISTQYDGDVEMDGRVCARLDSHLVIDGAAFGELSTMLGMEGTTTADTRSWFDPEAGRLAASMERIQVNMQVNMPAELIGAMEPVPVFLEMFVDSESRLLPD